jgi:hypothetical protein
MPETKDECAGEGQQQINKPTHHPSISVYRVYIVSIDNILCECEECMYYTMHLMTLQPFVRPWPPFQFPNPVQS